MARRPAGGEKNSQKIVYAALLTGRHTFSRYSVNSASRPSSRWRNGEIRLSCWMANSFRTLPATLLSARGYRPAIAPRLSLNASADCGLPACRGGEFSPRLIAHGYAVAVQG